MSRALRESLDNLRIWVFTSESRILQIANGQGIAGTRAAPTQAGTNDTKIGSRLDNGETFTKDGIDYKRFKFQVNKDADNKTLKELARKDAHKVWAEADMPIGQADRRGTVEKVFTDLGKGLDK